MAPSRNTKENGLSSILVAVSGETSDEEAVRLACHLLNSGKGDLYVVYVIEVGRGLPVDAEVSPATARAEEVLKHMEEVALPFKCNIQAELLQSRRAGPAVVQEAVDKQVDAIVLGVGYHEVYGSFSLGETAPYLLRTAPCRVILWRDPMLKFTSGNGRQLDKGYLSSREPASL